MRQSSGRAAKRRARSHYEQNGTLPFSGSAWAEWSRDARATYYGSLLKGDGPFLFAGEHMSYINGWQEGAVRSAHYALSDIASRMRM